MPWRAWKTLIAVWFSTVIGFAADPGLLRASKPDVRKEIVAAISGQLAAFRKQDVVKAYSYVAAELQAQKPLPLFVAIVKANYPEIWGNTRAECGIVRDDGAKATVRVHVFAGDEDAAYDYTLVREAGRWRIHGILRHTLSREEQI